MATPQELNKLTSEFYNGNPDMEDGRLRLHRIEYEVTLRTILNALPPGRTGLKILDIGGGTGEPQRSTITCNTHGKGLPIALGLRHTTWGRARA